MLQGDSKKSLPCSPDDFASLLVSDPPLFIVGGQAVNLWALYYQEYTSELKPFVSRDLDILGNRKILIDLANKVGVKPSFFSKRPPTNMVGAVIATKADGYPLLIEVLSSVYGIKNETLLNQTYTVSVGEKNVPVQVPNPIALLQAKIANIADLSQVGRQDKHHVQILAKLMPAYIRDINLAVVNYAVKERDMLNQLEYLINIITSTNGRKVLDDLNISGRALFPEIAENMHIKLQTFMTKRLTKIFPKNSTKHDFNNLQI
jgi:hypothetical protein